ncbi:MAG TPA: chloride channel protein [Hyphomicrobium sp.]|jgi:CIC family chloride channel protein
MPNFPAKQRFKAWRWAVAVAYLFRVRLRKVLRDDVFALVLAGALVGALSGALAALMVYLSQSLHRLLFALSPGERLSSATQLPRGLTLVVLAAGGLIVGATYWYRGSRRTPIVDPIEANALLGGRMSLTDSTYVAIQSVLSSGFGLSLGIEGGFTQIASAVGSKFGQLLNRRRHDVRMLVGAGAAGGIAGAFGAPFAGAAYGFELIVGSYTVANLAPVVMASVAGMLTAHALFGHTYHLPIGTLDLDGDGHIFSAMVLGVVCGLLSVLLMRGVTATEHVFHNSGVRTALRPVAGGLLVAAIAISVPHVLGSGHDAMALMLKESWPLATLTAVLVAKIAASALSLGSGFRGGLFSTSLFLGMVTGTIAGQIGQHLGVFAASDIGIMSLVGMASFGAAVIGAPMTMALLAIEVTGDFSVVGPVLLGVLAATLTVRQVFGYSFATWRFHLRGEAILSGEDVSWVRQTTARQLMRRDITLAPATMRLSEFQSQFPVGASKYIAAVDANSAFVGLVDVALVHAEIAQDNAEASDATLDQVVSHKDGWVDAQTRFDRLMPLFEARETELLVVVEDKSTKRVIGLITEAFALRRYRQELEARQQEMFGA